MPVKHLTDAMLRALIKDPPVPPKQIDYFDDETRGLFIKHSYGGTITFYLMFYERGGKSRIHKLGRYPALKLSDARVKAQRLQVALHDDRDHFAKLKQAAIDERAKRLTFAVVVANFKKLYVEKNKIRTGKVIGQQIDKHLMPTFADREFKSIRRSEITERLDVIEDEHGASMADAVLAVFRSIASFHETRDDDYRSPIVKKMKRSKPNPRNRVLSHDEIRALWKATDGLGTYGAIARVCLLTGQRRAKVTNLKWDDIDNDGVWTLGHEEREKPNCGLIKLASQVVAIIEAQPVIEGNPYVFPAMHKRKPFNAFGQHAVELTKAERETLPDMREHTLHDLRRTFRTLCSEIDIDRDTAERCMGHLIGNQIERTYDVHKYTSKMTAAFAAVAQHVQNIVSPPPSNVVKIHRARGTAARTRTT